MALTESELENRRVEYAATNDAYMHYDGFRWQAGSFLITGVFVFWGLLFQQEVPDGVIVTASFLITGLMSVWLLYAYHYRQIYMAKLRRIWELEEDLGARQHTDFREGGRFSGKILGPRGHYLDVATYLLTSLGSVALGWSRSGFEAEFLLPVPIALIVSGYVLRNEIKSSMTESISLRHKGSS